MYYSKKFPKLNIHFVSCKGFIMLNTDTRACIHNYIYNLNPFKKITKILIFSSNISLNRFLSWVWFYWYFFSYLFRVVYNAKNSSFLCQVCYFVLFLFCFVVVIFTNVLAYQATLTGPHDLWIANWYSWTNQGKLFDKHKSR